MALAEQGTEANVKASRIEHDAGRIRQVADHLHVIKQRVMNHARRLGYFQDTPETTPSGKIKPISTTMLDAIGDLERASEELSGSLNIWD